MLNSIVNRSTGSVLKWNSPQFALFLSITAASWQGTKGKLTLHYENGFALYSLKIATDNEKPKLLWYYEYEKLRMSSDDGHRLLWLDFGEQAEKVGTKRTADTNHLSYYYLQFSLSHPNVVFFIIVIHMRRCHVKLGKLYTF